MKMRHEPRLAGNQFEQGLVHLDAVERRQAQALQPRLGSEQALAQLAEAAGVVSDVDAGQDDLPRSAADLARDGITDRFERQRNAGSSRLPDGTESAAMIAAGLDRDEAF